MDAAEVLAQLRSDAGLREMARALILGDELLQLPDSLARLEAALGRLTDGQARLVEAHTDLQRSIARLFEGQAKLFDGQAKLFEGQAKLEQAVERLTDGQAKLFEGQAKLEQAVERLTDGQAKLFEGQAKLEQAVERLTDGQAKLFEGQAKLEHRVDDLAEGHAALRKEMGALSRTLGGTAEEDALDALERIVRVRGYRFLDEPRAVDLDGDGELDLAARIVARTGEELSVLVEAKVRLRAREVRHWAARVRDPAFRSQLAEAGLPGPYLVYAYGIRVYEEARESARSTGIGVLSSRGEDVTTEPLAA